LENPICQHRFWISRFNVSVNKEQNLALLPTQKSHFILGIDDVKYYDVKTPTTSFVYHNAMKQGAALKTILKM
jgi:hypothetical protein